MRIPKPDVVYAVYAKGDQYIIVENLYRFVKDDLFKGDKMLFKCLVCSKFPDESNGKSQFEERSLFECGRLMEWDHLPDDVKEHVIAYIND